MCVPVSCVVRITVHYLYHIFFSQSLDFKASMPLSGHLNQKGEVDCVFCNFSLRKMKIISHMRFRHFLGLSPACGICFGKASMDQDPNAEGNVVMINTRSHDTFRHLVDHHDIRVCKPIFAFYCCAPIIFAIFFHFFSFFSFSETLDTLCQNLCVVVNFEKGGHTRQIFE